MQRFNSNNLESRYIKNLLKNTYLPTLPIVTSGDYIVKGAEYFFNGNAIKCTKSGTLDSDGTNYKCDELLLTSNQFLCGVGVNMTASYTNIQKIDSYSLLPGLNYKYVSNSDKYDSETHRHLGNYLRWYKCYYDIDLMSLYNCFCGESVTSIHLSNGAIENKSNSNYSVWVVPAQLNKTYTIFANSSHNVSICGVLMNDYGRVKIQNSKKYLDESLYGSYIECPQMAYNNPILYEAFTNDPNLISYNNNFYIVIQTEAKHFCPIVVLEGNYKNVPNKTITSSEILDYDYSKFSPATISSMTAVPTTYITPYSNKLISYLLEHPITSKNDIGNNIKRVQVQLNANGESVEVDDVWSSRLKYIIYHNYHKYSNNKYLSSKQLDKNHNPIDSNYINKLPEDYKVYENNNKDSKLVGLKNCKTKREFETQYDILGYVDKDVENSLFKYRSV